MSFFFLISLFTTLTLALYLGWRFRWAFGAFFPQTLTIPWVYWSLFVSVVGVFPFLYFFVGRTIPFIANSPTLLYAAMLLFALVMTAFTATLTIDIVCLLLRKLPFIKTLVLPIRGLFDRHRAVVGVLVLMLIAAYYVIALSRAAEPRETFYSVTINKPLKSGVKNLRIVQISDTHIAGYTSQKKYRELVTSVNALKPDIIVFTGDIIDRSIDAFEPFIPIFKEFRARHGKYAVLGNHEYFGNAPSDVENRYRDAGMLVLRDSVVRIDDLNLVIAGREDRSYNRRFAQQRPPRQNIAELLKNANKKFPIILLDHQPYELNLAQTAGVDLEFSGHTHDGQFYPLNFIVAGLYDNPWGLLTRGNYHSIVSCGVGTWGPPIRTPSFSEVVVVDVRFQ
jgi:predicted MPP superfamily phosphohydrolase